MRAICNGPIRQRGEEWWEIHQCAALYCSGLVTVQLHELPPSPLSLSFYIASCRQATKRSQVIVVVIPQNLEEKKNTLSRPLFFLFFVSLFLSFGHVVLTLTENRPDVVDFKRNKVTSTKKKKSGPPCGVDFKRELTSSVLTSRGFHCIRTVLFY